MVHVHAIIFRRQLVTDPLVGPYRKNYADYTLEVVESFGMSLHPETCVYFMSWRNHCLTAWRDHSGWLDRLSEDTVEYDTYRDPFSFIVTKYAECRKPHHKYKEFRKPRTRVNNLLVY
jgi:hypothetical protein